MRTRYAFFKVKNAHFTTLELDVYGNVQVIALTVIGPYGCMQAIRCSVCAFYFWLLWPLHLPSLFFCTFFVCIFHFFCFVTENMCMRMLTGAQLLGSKIQRAQHTVLWKRDHIYSEFRCRMQYTPRDLMILAIGNGRTSLLLCSIFRESIKLRFKPKKKKNVITILFVQTIEGNLRRKSLD